MIFKNEKKYSFKVVTEEELMPFLIANLPNKSRSAIKSYLAHWQVRVDNEVITKFNHKLKTGNLVEIDNKIGIPKPKLKGITIVYEDEFLIVIDKDAGLLTMATEKGGEITAYNQLRDYVKTDDPQNKIFIVHRLDKDTSGLMVFAKSEEVKLWMQENWDEIVSDRNYVAVVEGVLEKEEGTIQSYLKENGVMLVFSSAKPNGGKLAITHYRTLKSNQNYTLIELSLETGRKNQIRVHMQDIGHSVVGDRKYGAKSNDINRLALHAWKLAFTHPDSEDLMEFESPIPHKFKLLI